MAKSKLEQRLARKKRIRKKLMGTPEIPRLSVYRSLRYVYAQIIDDLSGKTLVHASSLDAEKGGSNKSTAEKIGQLIAERAVTQKISQVCFDRNGFLYHGVIKSLADGARKGGLKF